MVADELRRQCDAFLDLDELKNEIARRTFEPRERMGERMAERMGERPPPPPPEARERPAGRLTPANPYGTPEPPE
jgi:hypothetical protein